MDSRKLLPGYMQKPRWLALAFVLDVVLTQKCDRPIEQLSYLASLYPVTNVTENEMVDFAQSLTELLPDKAMINDLSGMGLDLANSDRFESVFLSRIRSVYASFMQHDKGTTLLCDMLSYALNIDLKMFNLWVRKKDGSEVTETFFDQDIHETFRPSEEYSTGQDVNAVALAHGYTADDVGRKIFPSTYLELTYTPNDLNHALSLDNIVFLLKSLLNYNLVFKIITSVHSLQIVPENRVDEMLLAPNVTPSDIIAIGALVSLTKNLSGTA